MATLYVSYIGGTYRDIATGPFASETVTTSGSSAAGGTIPAIATVVSVYSDAAHYVTIGEGTPTASAANSIYVPAGVVREIALTKSAAQKVAAITA